MNILIPMAGEGKRFREEGYQIHKPAIPVTDWRTGEKVPLHKRLVNPLQHI